VSTAGLALGGVLLLGSGLAVGCADAGSQSRAVFLREVLLRDNRVWLSRPEGAQLVADKFAKMASDPYFFMRGTAALHFADLARPDASRPPTSFLTTPDSTAVLLFGDPHPENATVCHGPDGRPTVEFVDLDASGFGPWTLDLRRAALGLGVLAEGLPGCEEPCREAATSALVAGYLDGLDGRAPALGVVFEELVDDAHDEGSIQQKTLRYAPIRADGSRALLLGEDTALAPLNQAEDDVLQAILDDLEPRAGIRVLDAARRYGSGVTSLPALRFVLLYDRGDESPADDGMLQVREVVDPPAFPGRAIPRTAAFEGNSERVVVAARRLWSRPDADPFAFGVETGAMDFKSLSWTSWFQDVDHLKVGVAWAEGELSAVDIAELGEDLGRTLGGAHARAGTASGGDAGAVIRADLEAGGGEVELAAEVLRDARIDRSTLASDHALFLQLLADHGPVLGFDTLSDGLGR
jgi:hypothetical protein